MTPQQFIAKWRDNPLKERASYQLHFLDLCELLGVAKPTPQTADSYCFEKGANRTGAAHGWADVWKQGHFAIEYKAAHRNLGDALKQLMTYALSLENPPLLVVCDTNLIHIHTHFTNAPSEVHTIALDDLAQPDNLKKLRWLFTDPNQFHPRRTIAEITEKAAAKFAELAQSLNARHDNPHQVAHFLNQCLFCLFAEDAQLLPPKLFERVLEKSLVDPERLERQLRTLFSAMQSGGDFGADDISWFNGGLFQDIHILRMTPAEIKTLYAASQLDWSGIEPSIFGTLFERGLDPAKRSQLGAHYTDAHSILRIIQPVILDPLSAEWQTARADIAAHLAKHKRANDKAYQAAQAVFIGYLERLKNFRVLDPACGSGNFLYLALRALKDLEHRANLDAEMLGLHRQVSIGVSPANVLGIELNTYAAELARVVVWIGEIQWALKNGYPIHRHPILQSLAHIENRDALMCEQGAAGRAKETSAAPHPSPLSAEGAIPSPFSESDWPAVDAIIGNPPFLGGSKMRSELGDAYTDSLRTCYDGRVPGGADLVVYWFEKARAQIAAGYCQRAGLVATNSIRGGANQKVLARIVESGTIFNAWSDEAWVNDGAAVRVSLVCFGVRPQGGGHSAPSPAQGEGWDGGVMLNDQGVACIHADLTAGEGLNLTQALPLKENAGVCFMGASKKAPFDMAGELARQWLTQPNPNGKPNSEVVRPLCNALNITRRPTDVWIVDFGTEMSEAEAALYEIPFAYVVEHVKPVSQNNRDKVVARNWWRHARPRIEMREAIRGLPRYIATPGVSKHRLFVFLDAAVLPDQATLAIARSDDTTFGILHSRFHELWALRLGTSLEDRPRYTPTTTFETFPFPPGLTPDFRPAEYANPAAADIAAAAQRLNELRENWLNPPQWVTWEQTPEEAQAGFPARPVAQPAHAAELKKRTLTNLYNARPAWLSHAHQTLDAAVAKAYGWTDYTPELPDDEILRRLLALNLARANPAGEPPH